MSKGKIVPLRMTCICGTEANAGRRIYFPEYAVCAAQFTVPDTVHELTFEEIVPQVITEPHTPAPRIRRETY